MLGAVVSSTDAAAVFSVLRGSGLHLKRRVGVTLEVESGINDPVAVMLTTALTAQLARRRARIVLGAAASRSSSRWSSAARSAWRSDYGGRALLRRVKLPGGGLYPALTLGDRLPRVRRARRSCTAAASSSVYVTALILGNGPLPYRAGLLRVHHALAWLGQVVMFLVLGLLVFPSRLFDVAGMGLALALFLAVVARPVVVWLCLLPFGYRAREVAVHRMGRASRRRADHSRDIPVLAGAPGALRIFDVVFFIVVINALVPGATVGWVTRRARARRARGAAPPAVLEIESMQPLNGELMSFYVDEALAVAGCPLADLPFPDGASVAMIVRGQDVVPPKGDTTITAGDHVYVFARTEDRPLIHLMFGRAEGD